MTSHSEAARDLRKSPRPRVRDAYGVLLRYEMGANRHPDQSKSQPSDRLRCAVLKSERDIRAMRVMFECLEDVLSGIALDRFEFALCTIESALNLARAELSPEGGNHE